MRSWLYRRLPSAMHLPWEASPEQPKIVPSFLEEEHLRITPEQLRLKGIPEPQKGLDFVQSWVSLAGAGDPSMKNGLALYSFSTSTSMDHCSFFDADGDLLVVPFEGTMLVTTEFGRLTVQAREIMVVPRGVVFSVAVRGSCRGWVAETFKGHFRLPELGPIGANGLANARDFQAPTAWLDRGEGSWSVRNKYLGRLHQHVRESSPFDVVAWQGNYYPYKYNLDLFNAMNTVTYDHPDPSIFTVLTCPSDEPGTALLDFVIFPPRWMVAEHSLRAPYYHRNCMSEFMGNISGKYDAKEHGFGSGMSSLHSVMSAHGPDADAFRASSTCDLKPVRYPYENLAFMFESCLMLKTTEWAL